MTVVLRPHTGKNRALGNHPQAETPPNLQRQQFKMFSIDKSHKLDNVCYDIRGPVHKEARRLEDEGHRILKLNIGNPAAFGVITSYSIHYTKLYDFSTTNCRVREVLE